jgi:hypothetical protein
MKWILAILCGLALQAGAITNGVFATKSPYVVEAASMPFDLWTNSVLWLMAESPVLNATTTNANWICYAKNCAGNATQTTVASQPATITTNGVKALLFDGGDFLTTAIQSSSLTNFTFSAWINALDISSTNAFAYRILTRLAGASQRGSIFIESQQIKLGLSAAVFSAGYPITTNTWYHAVGVFNASASAYNLFVNGVSQVAGSHTYSAADSALIVISKAGTPLGYFNGIMSDLQIYPLELSTNQVVELYNTSKSRYGL